MCQKRDDLNKKIIQCRSELSKICPAILVQSDHKSYVLLQNFRLGTSLEDRILRGLRWLKTVSSTKILMGCYSHSLSLAATIMISKNCPIIGEHVVVLFIT